jgi:Trypsin
VSNSTMRTRFGGLSKVLSNTNFNVQEPSYLVCVGLCALVGWITLANPASSAPTETPSFKLQPARQVDNLEVFGDGSRDANPLDWPSTFIFVSASGENCTATAVSAQVILTAAHCVSSGSQGELEQGRRPWPVVVCETNPKYPANENADFSFCTVTPNLPPPSNGFEVISTQEGDVLRGAPIRLVGFGCRMAGGVDRGFGRLGEGDATIAAVTADYLFTDDSVTICLGDSGGGAYVSLDKEGTLRRLVAINSKSDLEDLSRLCRTSSALFREWTRKWTADHKVFLCGLDPRALHCHQ